jgi:hypothetical protein
MYCLDRSHRKILTLLLREARQAECSVDGVGVTPIASCPVDVSALASSVAARTCLSRLLDRSVPGWLSLRSAVLCLVSSFCDKVTGRRSN